MTAPRYVDVFDTYNRFISGDKILEKDWDYYLLPNNASLMKKRYGISFGSEIIPEDQDMLDRLFVAGIDMLITTGVYNRDTGTRLKLTEDEIYEGLKMAPKKLTLGEGKDAVECTARRGNSMNKPIIEGGPTGAPVSEAIYPTLIESYAQEPMVDAIVTGVLETVKGHPSVKNSPWEVRATMHELTYAHNALIAAGRPGMAI
ncbi:MAG: monomethylamine:corrinoid methyltransferase [Candidatus Methanomethylophilaceae archaeon]|nr:monomethylamine:corrinoid methyltransferase [Candidatus Methanomethylophilaceae archaeon]